MAITKRALSATTQHATRRLITLSDSVINDALSVSELSKTTPELELYRRHFLKENGENCYRYRLSLLLLSLSQVIIEEEKDIVLFSDFVKKYPIFDALLKEVNVIFKELR